MECMDTPKKLTEWLRKMGYDGKTPSNFKPFCNAATFLLWEQLVHTVKPKCEVEHIRNNILINRLSRNDETCCSPSINQLRHESDYPIKEIEVWHKRQKLKKQINAVRDRVDEAKTKSDTLSTGNKVKFVRLENIRQRIYETHKQTFLLNAKSRKIEAEIAEVEEMLTLARNLTPVESNEQNNTKVLETLNECSTKLRRIIEKQNEAPSAIANTIDVFEIKTPFRKGKENFMSCKKSSNVFTSTKISNNNRKQTKQSNDDSLGLLDDFSMTFDNALAASSFKDLNLSNVNMCYDVAILNDCKLNESVKETLYKYDRSFIFNSLARSIEVSRTDLVNAIMDENKQSLSELKKEQKDGMLSKLYAKHVEYELQTVKTELNIAQLKQELNQLQAELNTKNSDLNKYLQLQRKEAGLRAALQYVQNIIDSTQKGSEKQDELRAITEKARNLEDGIVLKSLAIEHKLRVFKQIHDAMTQNRYESRMLARKLWRFTASCDWMLPLNANLSSMEIETFLEFPLEYNRKTTTLKTFYRDLPINYVPYQDDYTLNTILMLLAILQNPYSPAEMLLLDIIKSKLKMKQLRDLKFTSGHFESKGYTLEQLESQESYINFTLDKLRCLIHSSSSNKPLSLLNQTREVMKLWMEMPMKDFIAPNRLFNKLPYEHYDKLFQNFYKQL